MAKPDLDGGYFQLAHELDAALAVADFTKGARIVLREVFAQIFFPAFRKTATLSPTDIAGRVGKHKQHIVRATSELVKSGVLEKQPDGTYRFIKNYESWTTLDGSPRLTPEEIRYAHEAPDQSKSYAPKVTPKPIKVSKTMGNDLGTRRETIQVPGETIQVPDGKLDRFPGETIQVPGNVSPQTPIEERAREEELERKREDDPPTPQGVEAPTPPVRSAPQNDPAEVAAVAAWANDLPGHELADLGLWVRQMASSYPASWIRDAITEGLGVKARKLASYAHGCLKRWHVAGKPDLAAEERAAREARKPRPEASPASNPLPPSTGRKKVYVPRQGAPS